MAEIRIPELNARFIFRSRPEPVPGDLRPLWRIALVLLILEISSRGGRSSFGRLHVLNWGMIGRKNYHALEQLVTGTVPPDAVTVRIEPSLNRAVDLARGEGLTERSSGHQICLTGRGRQEARKLVIQEGILEEERQILQRIGKKVTEQLVKQLFNPHG